MTKSIYKKQKMSTAQRKQKVQQIKDSALGSATYKRRDIECWSMYNEHYDETEFEYLTKIGDFDLPARIRNVGKQRPKINRLAGQQARRPFMFSVTASDESSLKSKYTSRLKDWLNRLEVKVNERYDVLNIGLIKLEQQQQALQQMADQEPQDEAQAQRQRIIQQQLPEINYRIESIKKQLSKEVFFTEDEMRKVDRYQKYDMQELSEEFAQKLALKLRQHLDIDSKSTSNFISQSVTGKQCYYVDYIMGEKLPRFDSMDQMKVYFPATSSIRWIENSDWVVIEEIMSYSNLIKMYGDRLSVEEKERLKEKYIMNIDDGNNFVATPNLGALLSDSVYFGTEENVQGIRIHKIWDKEEVITYVKKSPNKYNPAVPYTHFIGPDKTVLDKKDYFYKNGFYFNKKNKKEFYSSDFVEAFSSEKGEEIKERYYDIRYKSVIIDDDIIIDYGIDPVQPRRIDDLRNVYLPVVGRTYNSITNRPYSLIWSTKDLQKLYRIVSYHRELMLAISGTRGNVIDMSQKPAGMSRTEWEYQIKMGRLYIETEDELTGRKKGSSFNQWPSYDNTVSQAIQFLDAILQSIDSEIGETMGLSRPSLGKQAPTDKVGISLQSQQMTDLITEILFTDHDEVEARALRILLNLTARYCNNEDLILELNDTSLGKELFKIPKGKISHVDFDILVANNSIEEKNKNELKQLALRYSELGQLPYHQLIDVWTTDSLMELTKKFEYFSEESQNIQRQLAQDSEEQRQKGEESLIRLEKEYEKFFADQLNKIKKYSEDIKLEKVKSDKEMAEKELAQRAKEAEDNKQLELLDLTLEDKTETLMLESNDKHQTVQEQLKALELKMNAIISGLQIKQSKEDGDKKHKETMKKMDMQNKKGSAPEHVNDN